MSEKPAEKKEEGKKGGNKMVLIIVAALVVAGGGGGGYWWFAQKAKAEEAAKAEKDGESAKAEEKDAAEEAPAVKKKRKKKDPVALVELEPYVVNLADTGGNRYVKVRVSLGVDSKEVAEALEEPKKGGEGEGGAAEGAAAKAVLRSRVRSTILEILASFTADEMTSPEGKTALKQEIMEGVTELLSEGEIVEVLFADLIVQ
ncbi:MAG: flagellar basal body-associated FliL family protein [Vicinamibacterales bacterium]